MHRACGFSQGGWWHVDQNALLPEHAGRVCVQGLVSFTAATADTGGLCVIPGSHRQHTELCHRSVMAARMKIDFVTVDAGDPILADGGVLVTCEAGDLIVWDSRTVHCNTPSLNIAAFAALTPEEKAAEAAATPADLLRLCAYVCMVPAAHATQEILDGKIHMFQHKMRTSHWPTAPCPGDLGPPLVDLSTVKPEVLDLVGVRQNRSSASSCVVF